MAEKAKADYILYTDGSCKSQRYGGWASIWFDMRDEPDVRWTIKDARAIKGHEDNTTNNRMELLATINGFNAIAATRPDEKLTIVLKTDSKYVITAIRCCKYWAENDFKLGKTGTVLSNSDLLRKLHESLNSKLIFPFHVKGHSGERYNTIVDRMAQEEADLCRSGTGA